MRRQIIKDGILHNKDLQEFNLTPAKVDLILDYLHFLDKDYADEVIDKLYDVLKHDLHFVEKGKLRQDSFILDKKLPTSWRGFLKVGIREGFILNNDDSLALVFANY